MTPVRFVVWSRNESPCDVEGCTRQDCKNWKTQYALPDGRIVDHDGLEPGDCYFWEHEPDASVCPWSNCDGKHLVCVLPNDGHGYMHHWNIDGRASNCTMKEDKTHRCWIRTGRPEDGTLDVGKAGHTCQAGAGSIAVDGYHGFLRNGSLDP